MKRREAQVENGKEKVVGWSTKVLEEVTSKRDIEEMGEMVQWKSINQEEVHNLWKELCGKIQEEVLEKYKVEEFKRGACKGRGEPLEWRIIKREDRSLQLAAEPKHAGR